MNKFILLCAIVITFSGCKTTGTKVHIDRSAAITSSEKIYKELPELGEIITKTPGESLVSSFVVTKQPGIKLLETVQHDGKFNGFTNTYIVKSGTLPVMAENHNGKFYGGNNKLRQIVSVSNTNTLIRGGIFIPNSTTENHSLFLDNTSVILEPLGKKVKYKPTEIVNIDDAHFKQELIYTGKSGDNINIEYREFKDNMIRASFSQNLTYDISKDQLIGFRGALFEVISATNSTIKYKVIKHLNHVSESK